MKGVLLTGNVLASEFVTAACAATGQTAEVVAQIVTPIMEYLQRNYGGEQIYIPKVGRALELEGIYRDFIQRMPKRDICRKYGISMRMLNRIIDEALDEYS